MINIDCTILTNLDKQLQTAIISSQFDMSILKKILSLIIVKDMIKWIEKINPESVEEAQLVRLKNKLLMCYEPYLKMCRTYDTHDEEIYTNVNTAQTNYTWDRIWDNFNRDV